MRISSFEIQNYRSIERTGVSRLGPLVVLIGKNSAGKSNVLEALASVFQNFDVAGGNTPGIDDYVFYMKRTGKPARFLVTVDFDDDELDKIFPNEWVEFYKRLLTETKNPATDQANKVSFVRELHHPQGNWTTPELTWGKLPLVSAKGPLAPEDLTKAVQSLAQSLGAQLAGGGDGAAGAQVVAGTASAASSTATVAEPLRIPQFTPKDAAAVLGELSKSLKAKFKLISIARDIRTPGVLRDTIIDASAQNQLWTLDQSIKAEDEAALRRVDTAFERVTGGQLDFVATKAYLRQSELRIPLTLEGGGIQSTFNLTATLYTNPTSVGICALEEPEGHAHPDLQRRLFDSLRDLSDRMQIFVATHSQIFVDRMSEGSLFIVKNGSRGTTLEPSTDYVEVLRELGAKPSDLFFSTKVLLVEGASEEIVVPAMAAGAGIELKDVQVIQVGGKGGARARAETLLTFAKDMVVPFAIFDKDGAADAEKLASAGLIPESRIRVLSLGTIEDYYPPELVEAAVTKLEEEYGLKVRETDGWKKVQRREIPLAKFDLGSRAVGLGGGWKVILARTIAPALREDSMQVPEELRRFLKSVADSE